MFTVTFPWQHKGLQALSVQRIKSAQLVQEVLFAVDFHSVGVSGYGHYTEQVMYSFNDNQRGHITVNLSFSIFNPTSLQVQVFQSISLLCQFV